MAWSNFLWLFLNFMTSEYVAKLSFSPNKKNSYIIYTSLFFLGGWNIYNTGNLDFYICADRKWKNCDTLATKVKYKKKWETFPDRGGGIKKSPISIWECFKPSGGVSIFKKCLSYKLHSEPILNKPSFCSGICDEWHATINFQ